MGMTKQLAGLVMAIAAMAFFSTLFMDSMTASGDTTNLPYGELLNNSNKYYSGMANQTQLFQSSILASSDQQASSNPMDIIWVAGQSIALAINTLIASLGIWFVMAGILTYFVPASAIFVGLGILWVVLSYLLSVPKAIKLGDTSG